MELDSLTPKIFGASANQFAELRSNIAEKLLETTPVGVERWQTLDVSGSDAHRTYELLQPSIYYDMPETRSEAHGAIHPDLPWAEGHFQERVGGEAINPGYWHARWPYHAGQVELHQKSSKYDHNYMERFWPKEAGLADSATHSRGWRFLNGEAMGYRFAIGDFDDVVQMLIKDPTTRQAYLPIWFPEDTGATAGQRVPCTLGYHFMIRDGKLHMSYFMRSLEIYRHFTNDVYMAVRLAQEVAERVSNHIDQYLVPGQLYMTATSLHGFVGDRAKIEEFIL